MTVPELSENLLILQRQVLDLGNCLIKEVKRRKALRKELERLVDYINDKNHDIETVVNNNAEALRMVVERLAIVEDRAAVAWPKKE